MTIILGKRVLAHTLGTVVVMFLQLLELVTSNSWNVDTVSVELHDPTKRSSHIENLQPKYSSILPGLISHQQKQKKQKPLPLQRTTARFPEHT